MLEKLLEELISIIKSYNPDGDIEMVKKAFYFGEKAHEGQLRNSGEPFFIHPVHVAMIIADLNMDISTIIAGLLHDVIEDTDVTYEDIKREFGEDVAFLVSGVTKLKNLPELTAQESQAENLRKMVLAMSNDIRVIIVKLADRLHNMRTLEYMSEFKRREKAEETLEIYAPLAHRLGISKIKWELEDLSLRFLDPKKYYQLVDMVAKRRKEREEEIEKIKKELSSNLDSLGINYDISGRPKSFYSIYKKMQEGKTFEEIFDLTAIRVLVDTIGECYEVLGVVHNMWKPIPGRFKDYIAMPKPNMYQSIHTTVIGERGQVFEVQIRTREMHKVAEYGIAAHWRYKEGNKSENSMDKKLAWLRQLMEWQGDLTDSTEFMDTLKVDFFSDEVFVFSPRGDVINLPLGSTPVDFAYRIHTEVGHKCVGAKVDGRIVPLDYKLKSGNIVEIITHANSNGPSRDWLKTVKSNQARSKIRQWFKVKDKDNNIIRGKETLDRELKKTNEKIASLANEENMLKIANRLGYNNIDDLYAAIGYGTITPSNITARLRDEYIRITGKEEREKTISEIEKSDKIEKASKIDKNPDGIIIDGFNNLKVKFSKCCNPVPGDDIIGYITRGNGVSIHRKDCPNVDLDRERGRYIDVSWDREEESKYPVKIQIEALDRPGLLAEITKKISESGLSMLNLNARKLKANEVFITIILEISSKENLEKFMSDIKKDIKIIDIYRVMN